MSRVNFSKYTKNGPSILTSASLVIFLFVEMAFQVAVKLNISGYFYKLHRSIDVFDTILSPKVANDFAFLEGRYFLFVNSSVCVFVLFVGWLASQMPFYSAQPQGAPSLKFESVFCLFVCLFKRLGREK